MTHPIIPPPELAQEWYNDKTDYFCDINRAAQWGADQELEACCEWLKLHDWVENDLKDELRAARRPKPPSLKEQALEALSHAPGPDYPSPITLLTADEHALIRRALEQLDD